MPFCPRRAAAAGCSVGRRAKLVFLTHPHCPLTSPPSPRFGLWPARRASELLCCSRLVRRSDRARAMYVTKNVSVVRVRECLDHPRKGERREEGRKEGRKGREFFGQSTYRPRPAAASWPAGSRRSVHARHRGCSGETSTRDGCREGGGPGRRHVKKMVLRLSAAAAPLRTAH